MVDVFKFLTGLVQAGKILREFRPDVVFAKGGYVALPVVLAAKRQHIPVVVHESDSRLGLANRLAIPSASKVAVSFPIDEYIRQQPNLGRYRAKFIYTGLPLPDSLLRDSGRPVFSNQRPTILVTGGSQGAQAINQAVWEILPELLAKYNLVHQVGANGLTEAERHVQVLPPGLGEYYRPFGFDADFYQQALHAADLVVARAGSMVFELQALAKPAILIPLPHSAGGHQHRNAKFLVEHDAAVAIDQRQLTANGLMAVIEQLMSDQTLRERLAQNLSTLGKVNVAASRTLADLVIATAQHVR
ncbi:MAG: undecaprenyldiphospho-muramoylpentapeptide beta-N -acetylglucosaminyltransferase, UDP-N-acetylglucosamine--N-acetylmuramyl-(pentapeptide) pyrophosphoryl-undecaprenol N-acetylglucosamine transferase [candidate division Kazan bacterium GW2011_GWA1_50_15]|uniref:UDP-diphospho-muramoylpentapeptide beta-N-acetylglucosaminyltransferase n=2 Tax=Bacteria division Kazan-3B-28 TaxID=1798534 RepID=A0A0G1X7A5_UNCK3|nr:MAG: undecaprenyldiphospho-muramoylpentapeptide beta-N -acetylglucosaminyltransferase, UDP-N-acetylglucosamine--N-acetylmuramyl-(pentapeptide) pyrophosphoryl-undecaprenol N-acetylglucosamine transferase [candidate division Kazan bacterium GW2011_GWA1_50_15]KKW25561.1 MAG: UDP-diphospho-muramoylpentapeptide beta-N- acetylglucosaminyltransferase [candidate division Kazan bacterium GW2011_GWC1_52_13]KKW26866.1 MAG: UDP-diphospho-muramoylpentapeptide beta-N- acetylglucosaminyltransferase [candidat